MSAQSDHDQPAKRPSEPTKNEPAQLDPPVPQTEAPGTNAAEPPAPLTTETTTAQDASESGNEPQAAEPAPDDPDAMPPGAALWKYLEVKDKTDVHNDRSNGHSEIPGGFCVTGARVRGRKHKHDGTNCDDWFEIRLLEPWTIIAVSDGAGSCGLSRIGAKISTVAAVKHLSQVLSSQNVADLSVHDFQKGGRGADEVLPALKQALGQTMQRAHNAVAEEAQRRDVNLKELSGTLRLAIHAPLKSAVAVDSLVVACSIGDGMTAIIQEPSTQVPGHLRLLGSEESPGKYSGETEFLTDPRTLKPERLAGSIHTFIGPLRTLMVMSDGIADPYFPNNPGMLRLYADLVLNGVIDEANAAGNGETDASVAQSWAGLDPKRFSYEIETPCGVGETLKARIRVAERFLEETEATLEQCVEWPPVGLVAGSQGPPMTETMESSPLGKRLEIWVESFYVRGEFDDRALVILHRNAPPHVQGVGKPGIVQRTFYSLKTLFTGGSRQDATERGKRHLSPRAMTPPPFESRNPIR